jgi:hypothetical protein
VRYGTSNQPISARYANGCWSGAMRTSENLPSETVWKVAGRILNGVHQVAVVAKWGFCSPFLSFGGSLN